MDRNDEPVIEEEETLTRRGAANRFGKYRPLGRIGHGGMAEVFLAAGRGPAGFNKLVVAKRLRENVASDELFREMFLEEARLAARLNHPNVVQTYEVFEDGGAYFIIMEYLEGQPLNRIVRECARRGTHLSPGLCARIISDALCGLHYAHEIRDYDGSPLQIVHRDVSPQNIFVTYDGQVKVVDFGIAKAEGSQTKTQAGMFKGKTAYMAPEQLQGGDIDRRVDVFTTGIVLWELLCERRLMASESAAQTLVKLLQDPIPRVSQVAGHVEAALCQIVMRALERDPAVRFPSAGEMRSALEDYLTQSGQIVRSEDVGAIMTDLFSEVRAERQRQIREQMAHPSDRPSSSGLVSLPSMPFTPGLPGGVEFSQPASVSGINVTRTVRSATGHAPAQIVAAAPSPRGGRMLAIVGVGALCAAAGLVYLERARLAAPASAPAPAAAPLASAAPPASTQAPPPPEVSPASSAASPAPSAAEPAPAEAPSPHVAASPQATPRTLPQRWGRPTSGESKPASAAQRSSSAAQSTPAAAAAEPDAHAAPPPPPAPPTPSAPPTQEGRKFRTSL